jgi:hypothetical protein
LSIQVSLKKIGIIRIGKPPALPGRLSKFDFYGGRGFHRGKAFTSKFQERICSRLHGERPSVYSATKPMLCMT